MIRRPRLRPHIVPRVISGEGVFLLEEGSGVLLSGAAIEATVPLLDGRHTVDEIVRQLGGRVAEPDVWNTLAQLEQRGHLVDAPTVLDETADAGWSRDGLDPVAARHRLATTTVAVRAVNGANVGAVEAALHATGVSLTGAPAALNIIVAADYHHSDLDRWNQDARRRGETWFVVRTSGPQPWVGPMFGPDGACWECLAHRLRANRAVEIYFDGLPGTASHESVRPSIATVEEAAAALLAHEVRRWAVTGQSACRDTLITLDLLDGVFTQHAVRRRPQCRVCGTGKARRRPAVNPLDTEPIDNDAVDGGDARAVGPERLLARFEHHVSSITGLVSNLEPAIAVPEAGVYTYRSSYAAPTALTSLAAVRNWRARTCGGKGASEAQARAGALGEALERYSATRQLDDPVLRATRSELGDEAIDPQDCQLFSDEQFARRSWWNSRAAYFCRVPRRITVDTPLDWVSVWSLTESRSRYVPAGLAYLSGADDSSEFFVTSTAGLGAGNLMSEAVLHGLLEVVERDSIALWWYNRLSRPSVEWRSDVDERIERIVRHLESIGREYWMLDLTADTGVTTFAAISRRVKGDEHLVFGFGTHLNPRIALNRAANELFQMLGWVRRSGDESVPEHALAHIAVDWLRNESTERQPHLRPLAGQQPTRIVERKESAGGDVDAAIHDVRRRLEARGLEVLLADLTRSDVGLPTVRVIVPGLRPLWPRFAAGRLYEVPVELGWLETPRAEAELNPIPMFL